MNKSSQLNTILLDSIVKKQPLNLNVLVPGTMYNQWQWEWILDGTTITKFEIGTLVNLVDSSANVRQRCI